MKDNTVPFNPLTDLKIGKAIADASSVLLWIADTEKQCVYFNQAWLNYRGRTPEQEYGFGWSEGVHPDDYQRCVDVYVTAFDAREHFSMEYRLMKADGSYGWIRDDGAPYFDDLGEFQGYIGSCYDITETKNMLVTLKVQTAELETANLRLKGSVRAGQVGIWDWDIPRGELFWDEQMSEIYGQPPTRDPLDLSAWENALHPDDVEAATRRLHQALAGEKDYNLEFRIIRPDGRICYVKADAMVLRDEQGQPKRMLGTNLDITIRHEAEEEILRLERRNQALLDYSPVCHKIVDLDFNLRYMNLNGFTMLSLPVNDDWYGKPYPFSFFSDASRQEMQQQLIAVRQSKTRRAFELIAHDSQGNEVWLYHTIIPVLKTDSDELDYLTVVSADITEQKRIQEALRHREKMDAIGQLAGGVAHDFNNQLASILGYAEILKLKVHDDDGKKYLGKIVTSAERSANLTRQMLAFSRKQTLQKESTDLHTEITETIDLLAHSVDKRIEIRTDFHATRTCVNGDKSLLSSALLNMGINAADAMEAGGVLSFSTENVNATSDNFVQSTPGVSDETFIRIAVKDTGTGIDEATLSKIFDPFFTTKLPGKGTGMGLASVYGTLKQHNGLIRVESEVGCGSCFYLYLPVTTERPPLMTGTDESVTTTPATAKKQILVVDDEDSVRDLCCDILGMSDFDTLTASDGREAVTLYQTHWQNIDLVILDLVMPVMSGADALKALRDINPEVKVLISSGYNSGLSTTDIKRSPVTDIIEKPFNMQTLLSALETLLK